MTATSGPSGSGSFSYNGDGHLTSRSDAAGTTAYTYDKAGRLATTTDPLTGAKLTYGYNATSRPSKISYSVGGASGPSQTLAYNGLEELTGDTLTASGGPVMASASYGYDADGDLTSQTTAGEAGAGTTTYGYDEADRLTSATSGGATTSYGYDASGNLTQSGGTTLAYNAANQLTSTIGAAGTTSYSYTPGGDLSAVTPPSGSAQQETSNAFGQTVTAGGVSYGYDGLGRLVTRASGGSAAGFAYSGAGDTLASDGSTDYSYDPYGDLIGLQNSGGTAQSAFSDIHGDLTGTFAPTSAATSLTASAAYTPYGSVTATNGTMPAVGYQGQYTDPATGDVDMSARWYSPATGGFSSSDTLTGSPIGFTFNPSPYGYARDNPLTNADPTGHFAPPVILAPATGVGVAGGVPIVAVLGWGALGGAVLFGAYSFFFPTPLGGGNCTAACYSVGEGIPDQEFEYLHDLLSAIPSVPGGNGQAPGSCGALCYIPLPPPPPPPPPQDIYAGPNPAAAPKAPRWMRTAPYINTSAGGARHDAGQIIERTQPVREKPTGLSDILTGQPGVVTDVTGLTQSSLDQIGIPAPPAPSALTSAPGRLALNAGPPTPEATVGGAGGSGGKPPAAGPGFQEPDEPGRSDGTPKARFVVGSGGQITDTKTPGDTGSASETFYRTMSKANFEELLMTGRVPATGETFISPLEAYAARYEGTTVKFTVQAGTQDALAGLGVRDGSGVASAAYPGMSPVSGGWPSTSAFFKGEGGILNIGLGQGPALDLFNNAIEGFEALP
ncbi:MAG: RHS repeat-associated core domain-containing protein [Streptosporangiaceae bacterium]